MMTARVGTEGRSRVMTPSLGSLQPDPFGHSIGARRAAWGRSVVDTRSPRSAPGASRRAALRVQRFQNESDLPFVHLNGAAAVLDNDVFDATDLPAVDGSAHGNAAGLRLVVIRGAAMMKLVHALYEQAADEA